MIALKYRERWEEICREVKLKDMKEELIVSLTQNTIGNSIFI